MFSAGGERRDVDRPGRISHRLSLAPGETLVLVTIFSLYLHGHSVPLYDNSVISKLALLIHILFLQALQQQSLHARLGSLLTEFN